MTGVPEEVARVGLAAWVGERDDLRDAPPFLGILGDDLYLVEIEERNRERVLGQLVDDYDVEGRKLRIELVIFATSGCIFASSVDFLGLWPKSLADVPAEVFVDDHHRAAFTEADGELVMSVRHVLRPSSGPPRRRFRFRPDKYQAAVSQLGRDARRLRDDLIAVAGRRAPEKVESLREALANWPV